ncbi:MAG: hypothetical protein HJJLKODD_02296 [Phycisphaerae bacterium]|nr:hypothetical protein [Phycisphaerae bacterium]
MKGISKLRTVLLLVLITSLTLGSNVLLAKDSKDKPQRSSRPQTRRVSPSHRSASPQRSRPASSPKASAAQRSSPAAARPIQRSGQPSARKGQPTVSRPKVTPRSESTAPRSNSTGQGIQRKPSPGRSVAPANNSSAQSRNNGQSSVRRSAPIRQPESTPQGSTGTTESRRFSPGGRSVDSSVSRQRILAPSGIKRSPGVATPSSRLERTVPNKSTINQATPKVTQRPLYRGQDQSQVSRRGVLQPLLDKNRTLRPSGSSIKGNRLLQPQSGGKGATQSPAGLTRKPGKPAPGQLNQQRSGSSSNLNGLKEFKTRSGSSGYYGNSQHNGHHASYVGNRHSNDVNIDVDLHFGGDDHYYRGYPSGHCGTRFYGWRSWPTYSSCWYPRVSPCYPSYSGWWPSYSYYRSSGFSFYYSDDDFALGLGWWDPWPSTVIYETNFVPVVGYPQVVTNYIPCSIPSYTTVSYYETVPAIETTLLYQPASSGEYEIEYDWDDDELEIEIEAEDGARLNPAMVDLAIGNQPLVTSQSGTTAVEPKSAPAEAAADREDYLGERLSQAETAFSQGDYLTAKQHFTAVMLEDINNGAARIGYGLVNFVNRDYRTAARSLRKGLTLMPEVIDQPFDLTAFYGSPENLREQVTQLETVLKSQPKNGDAWFVLGFVQYFSRNYAQAQNAFSQALSIEEDDQVAQVMLDTIQQMASVPAIGAIPAN